jgi:hypothetical protein
MKSLQKTLLILSLALGSVTTYGVSRDLFYAGKLTALQNKIVKEQKSKGEWAGINEGDPRWDIFFMVYSYALYKQGLDFMPKAKVEKIVQETIYRVKTFRGFSENGWSLHANRPISSQLTGTILMGFKHINKDIIKNYFPTQQKYFDEQEWNSSDMSVLDRSLFRMMGVWSEILIPFPINPSVFSWEKGKTKLNMASLGYYRWGFVSLAVWKHYNGISKFGMRAKALSRETIDRGGAYIFTPELVRGKDTSFWAQEGLAWLFKRRFADGNPAPTLIVQMAFLSAHKAKAVNLTGVLKQGWEYMDKLRYKMRNNARVFQPSVSPVWDTARILSGLQYIPEDLKVNKLKSNSAQVKKALRFLLSEQDVNGGDYKIANPDFVPGGWGFAYGSNKYPDSDDTAMVVDALIPLAKNNAKVTEAVKKGVQWLVQMQNHDGGFPAWDFDATKVVEYLIQNTTFLPNTSLEPQSDISARVLRALKRANDSGIIKVRQSVFQKGCHYLTAKAKQSRTGLHLWAGTWAVNYLYGTSESLSTLIELGCSDVFDLKNYMNWIVSIQNSDGGWGESVTSYDSKDYEQFKSTITQTLGVMQLLVTYEKHRVENNLTHLPSMMNSIEKGVNYYLPKVNKGGDIHDENEDEFTACYACPLLFVRYDLIPLYMGTEVLAKFLKLKDTENIQEIK